MLSVSCILEKLEREIRKDKKEIYSLVSSGVINKETGDAIVKNKYIDMLQTNKNANKDLCEMFVQRLIDKV